MTKQERDKNINQLFDECKEILRTKGDDYLTEDDDVLSNFKTNAELLGLSKYQVWSVYFLKHVESVIRSIRISPENPQVESEPLENRIKDIINYASLLYCLLKEDVDDK